MERLTTAFCIVRAIPLPVDAALLIGSGVEATCKETRESVRSKRGLGAVLAMSMDSMIVLGAIRAEGADLPVGRFDPTTASDRVRLCWPKDFQQPWTGRGSVWKSISRMSPHSTNGSRS